MVELWTAVGCCWIDVFACSGPRSPRLLRPGRSKRGQWSRRKLMRDRKSLTQRTRELEGRPAAVGEKLAGEWQQQEHHAATADNGGNHLLPAGCSLTAVRSTSTPSHCSQGKLLVLRFHQSASSISSSSAAATQPSSRNQLNTVHRQQPTPVRAALACGSSSRQQQLVPRICARFSVSDRS